MTGTIKPNAKFQDVSKENLGKRSKLGPNDFTVFLAGTNDLGNQETRNLRVTLRNRLYDLRHTKVLLFSIPHLSI